MLLEEKKTEKIGQNQSLVDKILVIVHCCTFLPCVVPRRIISGSEKFTALVEDYKGKAAE